MYPRFEKIFSLRGNLGGLEEQNQWLKTLASRRGGHRRSWKWAKFVQRQIQFDGKTEQERKPTERKGCPACWGCFPTSGQCLKRAGYDGLFRKLFLPARGAWVWRISSGSDTVSKKKLLGLLLFSDSPRSLNRTNRSSCRESEGWLLWGLHRQLKPTLPLLQETILQLAGKLVLNAASFSVPYQSHGMLHMQINSSRWCGELTIFAAYFKSDCLCFGNADKS